MRKRFAIELHARMQQDGRLVLVTADLGFGLFDAIRDEYNGTRFFNTGAAEQAGMGIAVGLALEGKIPFIYSITPFLLWRAAETIRLYVNHESVPVKMIGSGRDDDYKHDGFSHSAFDDSDLMELFPNIYCKWPGSEVQIPHLLDEMILDRRPWYLNLRR